jgi:FMN phosphatase YigB (HAD superfamily)
MAANGVRLVVFDLGGVLVRICRSWAEGCRAAGVEVREGSGEPAAVERRRAWIRRYETGEIGSDEFFAGPAITLDGLYAPDEVRRVHHAWLLGEYPGVGGVLDAIEAGGVARTAILSNTNESHWPRLTEYPAAARVPVRHASHLLGAMKPSPEVYARFQARTGAPPGAILFFDDLEANVVAARGAGWRAERIDPEGDTAAQALAHLAAAGVVARPGGGSAPRDRAGPVSPRGG